MKKIVIRRINWILPIIISILYFFAAKQLIPTYIYLLLLIPVGLYYFPCRMVISIQSKEEISTKKRLLEVMSNLLFSTILGFSVISLYIEGVNIKAIISFLGLINIVAAIFYYITDKKNDNCLIHIFFIFIISDIAFL